MYRPNAPFVTAFKHLEKTENKIKGVIVKGFTNPEDSALMFGAIRTFGGTEHEIDGLTVIEETAIVDAWYRPELKAGDRIFIPETQTTWEILGTPEDIEMRHQFSKFKIRRITGGA